MRTPPNSSVPHQGVEDRKQLPHARHLRGTHRAIPRTHEHVYVRHVSAAANKLLPDPHAFSLLRSIAATCG